MVTRQYFVTYLPRTFGWSDSDHIAVDLTSTEHLPDFGLELIFRYLVWSISLVLAIVLIDSAFSLLLFLCQFLFLQSLLGHLVLSVSAVTFLPSMHPHLKLIEFLAPLFLFLFIFFTHG